MRSIVAQAKAMGSSIVEIRRLHNFALFLRLIESITAMAIYRQRPVFNFDQTCEFLDWNNPYIPAKV
jgi:hypothetical protein